MLTHSQQRGLQRVNLASRARGFETGAGMQPPLSAADPRRHRHARHPIPGPGVFSASHPSTAKKTAQRREKNRGNVVRPFWAASFAPQALFPLMQTAAMPRSCSMAETLAITSRLLGGSMKTIHPPQYKSKQNPAGVPSLVHPSGS